MNRLKIVLVEDEEILRESIKDDLLDNGYSVNDFTNPINALEYINNFNTDVIISDIRMPEMSGIELLKKIKASFPHIQVVIMTAFGSVDSAVEAMKLGAYDYITKPFKIDELDLILKKIEELKKLQRRNSEFVDHFEQKYNLDAFIGESKFVQELKSTLKIIAPTDSTVLITGETGTGKELIANLIHYNSPRRNKLLIKVSCGILSKEVIESELFGHERGAFTGAEKQRIGRFEKANGGTIYLDDIDDIPIDVQVKLLRVLQEQEIERVGSSEPLKINVRVIASTKKDLLQLSKEGKFREDLYYRLNILPIHLKPLRERSEDIIPLFKSFLREFCENKILSFDKGVEKILNNFQWNGNTRELKNFAERLAILCPGNILTIDKLPKEFFENQNVSADLNFNKDKSYTEIIENLEINLIKTALYNSGNNKAKAAELLKMPASTLKSKIEKFSIKIGNS